MEELPRDRLNVDRFYRTLQAYSIAAKNGATDPWQKIPWPVEERHAEIIVKLQSNELDDRREVEQYLLACLRLTEEPEATAKIIPFPVPHSRVG